MKDFFPIETPYSSEEYKILVKMVNQGIDSHLEGFTKSKFMKSPHFNNKFRFEFAYSELPILYRRMENEFDATANEDVYSLMEDIKSSVAENQKEPELSEMIDPFDPMDSGLNNSSIERTVGGENNTSTSPADEIEEGDSDSLRNLNGMNAKPNAIEEIKGERYEEIVFLQGDAANEAMDILQNEGEDEAMTYLKQWHYPGEHQGSNEPGHGSTDKTYSKDGYIMSWNPYIPYIGLVYDDEYNVQPDGQISEDSLAIRHQVSQRGKIGNVPLGQHSPHSPHAK